MKVSKKIYKSIYSDILTYDILKKEYLINKKSAKTIGKIFGCSDTQIFYRLYKFDIPIRTVSEAVKGSRFGKNNPNFGHFRKATPETIIKMRKAFSKEKNPAYIDGRTSKNYYCIDCSCPITRFSGIYGTGRCQSCSSKHQIKRDAPKGRIGTPYADYYKNIWMKSSWELNFAKWLDGSNIKWLYEPKIFDLGNITYTPDFYLPEFDYYIEIKGWWRGNAQKKFTSFLTKYNKLNIKLLQYKDLKEMSII